MVYAILVVGLLVLNGCGDSHSYSCVCPVNLKMTAHSDCYKANNFCPPGSNFKVADWCEKQCTSDLEYLEKVNKDK
jgi:hypothetical protein